jgi:uncharacterized protein
MLMMRTDTKLIVDVQDLLARHGIRKHHRVDEPVDGVSLELARVEASQPLHFDLVLEAIEGDAVVVQGPISGTYTEVCRRCLEESERSLRCEVREVFRPPADVWEEGYVVFEEKVDLRPMVRDNVLLALPPDPLCREDCRGLCTRCGTNRNFDTCDCTVDEPDPRWAALRELLEES